MTSSVAASNFTIMAILYTCFVRQNMARCEEGARLSSVRHGSFTRTSGAAVRLLPLEEALQAPHEQAHLSTGYFNPCRACQLARPFSGLLGFFHVAELSNESYDTRPKGENYKAILLH